MNLQNFLRTCLPGFANHVDLLGTGRSLRAHSPKQEKKNTKEKMTNINKMFPFRLVELKENEPLPPPQLKIPKADFFPT